MPPRPPSLSLGRESPAAMATSVLRTVGGIFRESGAALERLGMAMQGKYAFQEQRTWDRLRGCAGKVTRPKSCTPPLSGLLRHPE